MDLFEQPRREHEFGIGTIAGVAAKFGVHRGVVREAIGNAPAPKHRYPPRTKPKLDAVTDFIDKVLDDDRQAPRKQRHTVRRRYRRILMEFPAATVAESTARNHHLGCGGRRSCRWWPVAPTRTGCWRGVARRSIGSAIAVGRGHLLPCATEGFDLAEIVFPLTDKQGCVTVKTNFCAAPVRAGTRVEARIRPLHIEIWHGGRLTARHERCHSRRQHVLDLEHYPDILSHKSGAFAGSKPLARWREAGRWPPCYDELWARLQGWHGKQNGTRAMVAVLALGTQFGHESLRTVVAATVSLGACDVAAVRYLLTEAGLHKAKPEPIDVGVLACYDRSVPNLADKDTLLSVSCADLQNWASAQLSRSRTPGVGNIHQRKWASIYCHYQLYPLVFFDALRAKIRSEGTVRNKAVYLALGVRSDGTKEVLGLWIEQTEGAKFWLLVMNELRNRGIADMLIAVRRNE